MFKCSKHPTNSRLSDCDCEDDMYHRHCDRCGKDCEDDPLIVVEVGYYDEGHRRKYADKVPYKVVEDGNEHWLGDPDEIPYDICSKCFHEFKKVMTKFFPQLKWYKTDSSDLTYNVRNREKPESHQLRS